MTTQGKESEYVAFRGVRLPIYPYGDGYRFAYPDPRVKGGWRYGTRKTKKLAKEAAHAKAVEIANGTLDLANLPADKAKLCRDFLDLGPTRDDLERLRQWKQAESMPIGSAVDRFTDELPHPLSRHHTDLTKTLDALVEETDNKPLNAIDKDDLAAFLDSREVAAKRENQLRSYLVQFYTWAKREGMTIAPNGITIADRLPRRRIKANGAIRYLSPDEMKFLLQNVDKKFLPWLVLCGFAPIRSEELQARTVYAKPPLDWQSVKRSQGVIELPAENSKVKKRRIIPINSTLSAWLDYIDPPESGRIVPNLPGAYETGRLGKLMDEEYKRAEGWPRNVLRHTFLTYSAAMRKDLPAIAIEAGTSVQKLNSNYVEAAHEDEAREFFTLNPSEVFRM